MLSLMEKFWSYRSRTFLISESSASSPFGSSALDRISRILIGAGKGIRTLDLLHGKETL